eukprot:GHVS01000597.1.p1 GENE.GHVS01000597.1~~GHVS01000597.1.p1  ORF type:complete len:248 (+),score=27.64 GHVS01000597.1:170-913(+)
MARFISLFFLSALFVLVPVLSCLAEAENEIKPVQATSEEVIDEAPVTVAEETTLVGPVDLPKRALQSFVSEIIDASVSPLLGETFYSSSGNGERYYSNSGSSSNNMSGNRSGYYNSSRKGRSTGHNSCAPRGGHCHSSMECCDSMSCDGYRCSRNNQCGVAHSHCVHDHECCGSLECNRRFDECLRPCRRAGQHCNSSNQCCGSAVCGRDGRCKECLPVGAHCHSSSRCCGRSICRNGQCERHHHHL